MKSHVDRRRVSLVAVAVCPNGSSGERLFGYTITALGHNVNMLMPSPYQEEHDTYLARYLATGRAKIIGIGREVQGLRKDGTTFPLHLSVGQITIEGERKFTGILHDLSARVQMEGRLRDRRRWSSSAKWP